MNVLNTVLRTAAAGALATGLIFAQSAGTQPGDGATGMHHKRAGRRGAMRKLMVGYLGLTDQQQTQAKTIFQSARTSAQPIRTQLQQAREDLRAAIRDGKPVDQLAANEGTLMGKLAAVRANAAEQFRGILTPQQLQKLEQLHPGRGTAQTPPQG